MPDQPEPPAPGTPEYRWLYGDASEPGADDDRTRMVQRPGDPEATRMIPVVRGDKRPPRPPVDKPLPPARGVPPLPPAPAKPKRQRPPVLKIVLLVLVLWVAWLVFVPLWAMKDIERIDAFPTGDRPGDQDGTTYLVIGSDKADNLTPEQQKAIRAGKRSSARTDSIMLLHIGDGPDMLMSIPRDSQVEVPGRSGTFKINGTTNPDAFDGGGIPLLVETLEHNTGIRIDHVVQIGFGGFVDVVDAVGGIEICPDKRMKDKDARLNIKKGCQEVDGLTALGYARSRHAQKLGDIDRAKHQREVVAAVGKEAVSPWTVINPIRYWKLATAGAATLTVDEDAGLWALGRFALAMKGVGKDGLTCGVPIRDFAVNWDTDRAEKLFEYVIDDNTGDIPKRLCTADGLPR